MAKSNGWKGPELDLGSGLCSPFGAAPQRPLPSSILLASGWCHSNRFWALTLPPLPSPPPPCIPAPDSQAPGASLSQPATSLPHSLPPSLAPARLRLLLHPRLERPPSQRLPRLVLLPGRSAPPFPYVKILRSLLSAPQLCSLHVSLTTLGFPFLHRCELQTISFPLLDGGIDLEAKWLPSRPALPHQSPL